MAAASVFLKLTISFWVNPDVNFKPIVRAGRGFVPGWPAKPSIETVAIFTNQRTEKNLQTAFPKG